MELNQKKPHIAFLPNPGMGHITPHFQLASRLALHHHLHVSFLVITTGFPAAQHFLFRSAARGSIPTGLTVIDLPSAASKTPASGHRLFTLKNHLEPLKSILIELNPDSLIIDIFTTEAIDVCRELSIPVYSFFPASTPLLAFSLYLPTLDREIEGEFVDLPAPITVPGCPPIRTADILEQAKTRKSDSYGWYLSHASRLPLVSGIFVNTWEDFDSSILKSLRENSFFQNLPTPPIYTIGPLIKDDGILTDGEAEIISWLDEQPRESVLLVAFGSGGILSVEQMNELALGLEMSRQRFVLVVRKPVHAKVNAKHFNIDEEEDCEPSDYLPDGFMERNRGIGLVVSKWVPQVAVLRHPSTGGFLSHCGWNSCLEGVAHGVPIVAWPLHSEQRMNAAMLEKEIGVAVRVVAEQGKEVVGRREVERVVGLVMEGEKGREMRHKAKELKETAEKALEMGGSSFDSLSRFVELWKSGEQTS